MNMKKFDIIIDISESLAPNGQSHQLDETTRIRTKISKKGAKNKRFYVLLLLENSKESSITVAEIAKEAEVSRQFVYSLLDTFPEYKDKITRKKNNDRKKTTTIQKVLSYIDSEFENGNLRDVDEISTATKTTKNYVFTILANNSDYRDKVKLQKRTPRKTSNEEIIDFINNADTVLTVRQVADNFEEKSNVIYGVITRNKDKLVKENIALDLM